MNTLHRPHRNLVGRFAVLLLVLLLITSLTGCSGNGTTGTGDTTQSAGETPSATADPSGEQPTPEASGTETGTVTEGTTGETTDVEPASSTKVNISDMPYTNWTSTALGTIQWNTPAPEPIAYDASQTVTIAFPEGYNLVDICKALERNGVQTFYHTFTAALNNDFPVYDFLNDALASEHRRYVLDGYLFPDTYEFYVGEKPYDIFAKMLKQTEKVLKSYTPPDDMTLDDVIILASLIEEEASRDTRAEVSSVIHNRLAAGQLLEMDMSINYIEWYIKPLVVAETEDEINAWNAYYNTYKASCPGLPAGPVCNPGRDSIKAAISPADTDYFYFVTDADGQYYFAATYEEHEANLASLGLTETTPSED